MDSLPSFPIPSIFFISQSHPPPRPESMQCNCNHANARQQPTQQLVPWTVDYYTIPLPLPYQSGFRSTNQPTTPHMHCHHFLALLLATAHRPPLLAFRLQDGLTTLASRNHTQLQLTLSASTHGSGSAVNKQEDEQALYYK